MGRVRDRTFTGCWKCRARKVKCDETRPACRNCERLGLTCSGYDAKFSWIVEDEGQHIRIAGRRRALCCESTWKGFQVLPSDLVDFLILRCDESHQDGSSFEKLPAHHNPFSVFPASRHRNSTDAAFDDRPQWDVQFGTELDDPTCFQGQSAFSIRTALDPFPGRNQHERHLFHHYITQVAAFMMPYAHPKNPWIAYYPAAALQLREIQYDSLYNAILAQAAFNLLGLGSGGQDHSRLEESASRYYGNAMRTLLPVIGLSDIDFPPVIATVMTLMMAELYSGSHGHWRHHFRGAWNLLLQYGAGDQRDASVLARVSVQSLRILATIGNTSSRETGITNAFDEDSPTTSNSLVTSHSRERGALRCPGTTEFYYTLGAPRDVLDCITRITAFRNKTPQLRHPSETENLVETVLTCLRRYRQVGSAMPSGTYSTTLESGEELLRIEDSLEAVEDPANPTRQPVVAMAPGPYLQMNSFVNAAYIYLYRSVLNSPPRTVQRMVSEIFASVSAFRGATQEWGACPGNFSLWPAFLAAVEATRDEDIEAARQWMRWSLTFGIGIRVSVKNIVEEVWRRRNEVADRTGLDKDLIIVDWLQVMQDLDCDVLLI